MKRSNQKFRFKRVVATFLLGAFTATVAHANGGWVIKRDDKIDSPIFKQRPAIAHQEMAPEVERSYIAERYAAALEDYQSGIRRHWPNAEVSSSSRWVAYSGDYKTRRVVDFERNQMEISLENLYKNGQTDLTALRARVKEEVTAMLATRVEDAMRADPVASALDEVFDERGAARKSGEVSPLVFSEFFASAQPDDDEIGQWAERVLQRSRIQYQALSASIEPVPVYDNNRVTYVLPLPDDRLRRKAIEIRHLVQRYSKQFNLSEEFVMAMIHTESHFNPLARSHVPAFGLMQIVPSTSGREAAQVLYNKPTLLSPQYLYDPANNIEAGAAYLSKLYYQYMSEIQNPESRLYYVIASYNSGQSNAAKAFVSSASFQQAVSVINTLQPEQVLQRLMQNAPSNETRDYLEQVLKRRQYYKTL